MFEKRALLRSVVLFAALLPLVLPSAARAEWNEKHVEGAREHPLVKFYPQARVSDYDRKDFDEVEIITGYDKEAEEPAKTEAVEGRVTRYEYEHKPNTSALEIVRNYQNALKKAGFTTIVAGRGSSTPGLPVNPDDAFGAFRLDRDGNPSVYVNVVASYDAQAPSSRVTIVEIKEMEQKLEAGDADAWFEELKNTGRVAVYGITFDTGKATLRPESEKVLAEVARLLEDHKELKLRIEGHTDNVGSSAANKKLSEQRAAAVKRWLEQKSGVAANRLTAAGYGDSKPVADNSDEEGRAKNRRVELARQ